MSISVILSTFNKIDLLYTSNKPSSTIEITNKPCAILYGPSLPLPLPVCETTNKFMYPCVRNNDFYFFKLETSNLADKTTAQPIMCHLTLP